MYPYSCKTNIRNGRKQKRRKTSICMCTYKHYHQQMYNCSCICIHLYIHMYICMNIYFVAYLYAYTYVFMYIYIYTHMRQRRSHSYNCYHNPSPRAPGLCDPDQPLVLLVLRIPSTTCIQQLLGSRQSQDTIEARSQLPGRNVLPHPEGVSGTVRNAFRDPLTYEASKL